MENNDKKIELLTSEYESLNLMQVLGHEKYKLYSIVTNSTALEGSTLTDTETQILLDEGLAVGGKALEHYLMVEDNYAAISYAMKLVDQLPADQKGISAKILKEFNALNMHQTGKIVQDVRGTFDGRKGEFRQQPAMSQALGYYMSWEKIPQAVDALCQEYNNKMAEAKSKEERLKLCFEFNGRLVLIHPWVDGNKRTSRLAMNFLEKLNNLPLTIIHKEDGREYINSLKELKDTDNIEPLKAFLEEQHIKTLQAEIDSYNRQ